MSRYSGPRVPAAVGQILRLAGVLGRAREDHVEQRSRRHSRHQIHAHAGHAIAQTVRVRILIGRKRGVRIDVGRDHIRRTCPRCRERQDACAGADLADALAGQIERVEKRCELFAADEELRVKHRRPHAQAKARRVGFADILPRQDKLVRQEMDDRAKGSAEQALTASPAGGSQSWCSIQLWRRCRPGSHHPFNGPQIGSSDFKSLRFQGKVEMLAAP